MTNLIKKWKPSLTGLKRSIKVWKQDNVELQHFEKIESKMYLLHRMKEKALIDQDFNGIANLYALFLNAKTYTKRKSCIRTGILDPRINPFAKQMVAFDDLSYYSKRIQEMLLLDNFSCQELITLIAIAINHLEYAQ